MACTQPHIQLKTRPSYRPLNRSLTMDTQVNIHVYNCAWQAFLTKSNDSRFILELKGEHLSSKHRSAMKVYLG
jgi:hypothetical protein